MTSNLPRYVPPSVYTPFLRRFTDERALDLAETQALYEAITAQFYTSVLATPDVIDKFNHILTRQVAEHVDLYPGPVCEALDRCQTAVLALETTLFQTPVITDWSALSMREQVDLRRYLRAQQHVLAHQDRVLELLATALTNVFAGILGALPPLSQDSSLFQVPLFTFLDVNDIVDRLIGTLSKSEHDDNGLFVSLTDQLYRNLCTASKVMPHEAHKRPLITAADSDLPPRDLIDTYLKGTPFLDLFKTPVPFAIPVDKRFEHTHIVAGIGHGKTQLLQTMMLADFDDPNRPAVVTIDSQGDMIRTLSRLARFDPALDDRLILLDPADTEWPLKLNLFDVNRARIDALPRGKREQVLAGIIELYDYIFGALLGSELTAKQSVVFRFLAQLMLAIPNANIHTLKVLLEDPTPFLPYVAKLPPTARSFLEQNLFDPKEREYVQTRKQVLRRLYDILSNPTFERMFAHPHNALDMKRVLDEGKIVLVNTAKDVLKDEASATFGRFVIALILQAALERAADPIASRRAAFVYIDEAADYFDDNIDTLLIQARKYKVGLTIAHQFLGQLKPDLRASVMTNPAIRFAGGLSDMDARALASDMRTTSSFLLSPKKRTNDTEFACYVRHHTGSAIALELALGLVEREPQMSDAAFAQLQDRVRAEVAAPIAEVDALIAGTGTGAQPDDVAPSPPRAHADPASFDEAY